MPSLSSVVQMVMALNRVQRARPYIERAAASILRERQHRDHTFSKDPMADSDKGSAAGAAAAPFRTGEGAHVRSAGLEMDTAPPLPGDGSYEVVLSAMGTVLEKAPRAKPISGLVQFIQGAVSSNPADGYYAFISVQDVNVPLVPRERSRSLGPFSYEINIPQRCFELTLDNRTEADLIRGVEDILRWFTTYDDAAGPCGNDAAPEHAFGHIHGKPHSSLDASTAAAMHASAEQVPDSAPEKMSTAKKTQSAIDHAGTKGVELVTKYGEKINASIKNRADEAVANSAGQPARNVKMGGSATAGVLGGARKVVGAGANIASTAIDRVSTVVGNGIANNRVTVSMREAPENTLKRQIHDLLVAGALAIGRVYIAADDQGKLIIENIGDGAGRVAGTKYGKEAEQAARDVGHIGLDTYRIVRFPQKLGATSLVKGALKGATVSQAHANSQYVVSEGNVGGISAAPGSDIAGGTTSGNDFKPVEISESFVAPSAPPKAS